MLQYLMWQPKSGATATSSYRAPSWSWASLDGTIEFDRGLAAGVDGSRYRPYGCQILRCEITLKDQLLPYGEVNGGHIELSAVLRRAWYGDPLPYGELHWLDNASAFGELSEDVSSSVHERLQIRGRGTTNDFITSVWMDIIPSCAAASYNGEVFCVALWVCLWPGKLFDTIEGLMLMRKENDIYERIGRFESSTENFDGFPIQTITII